MEARANAALFSNGGHVGVEQAASTMHFGPVAGVNGFMTAHYTRNQQPGFDLDFHLYKLIWTETQIEFFIDNISLGVVHSGTGFWDRGGFWNSGYANPWAGASVMAPFDQEFFIIINNAVGGLYFNLIIETRSLMILNYFLQELCTLMIVLITEMVASHGLMQMPPDEQEATSGMEDGNGSHLGIDMVQIKVIFRLIMCASGLCKLSNNPIINLGIDL